METIIKQLYEALVEKYQLMEAGRCPKIAASFAVENYLSMYRHSEHKEIYLKQELEDVLLANEKRRG